jgi:outer membrane protein OmpU
MNLPKGSSAGHIELTQGPQNLLSLVGPNRNGRCFVRTMMKSRLLGLTALTAAFALSVPAALASDKVKLSLGGYYHFTAYSVDQSTRETNAGGLPAQPLRSHGFTSEGEVHIKGKTVLDDGLEVGFRAEFEIEKDNARRPASSPGTGNAQPNVQYSDDLIDEVWGYVEGVFGRVVFGQEDGVADLMGVFSPRVSESNRIDDAETYMFEDPGSPGQIYAPNGLSLRTDLIASDDSTKVIYITPRFFGLQLGASYTPELAKNYAGFVTRQRSQIDQQGEIWEFAANYNENFSNVDLAAYVGYVTGSAEQRSSAATDDLEEWGFGLQAKYAGFSLGGSYRNTNITGGGFLTASALGAGSVLRGRDTSIWSVGGKYETGPWAFGLNYVQGTAELATAGQKQKGRAYQAAASYQVGPGIMVVLGYQRWEFEAGGTLVPTFANSLSAVSFTPSNADADMIYLETALSF